jgi:uncharacterized protein YjbJ (UPF0337 family)
MKWNIVNENWKQFKRRVKTLWGQVIGDNGNLPPFATYSE